MDAAQALASLPPPPEPPVFQELTQAEKEAKEKLENPTVDEHGEHIQTVEEAKIEAQAMQQALDEGVAAVDAKIAARPAIEAIPEPEPVDDGHEETVEEVKAKMAAAQKAMDEGLANVDK
jgi:hypothetical protein